VLPLEVLGDEEPTTIPTHCETIRQPFAKKLFPKHRCYGWDLSVKQKSYPVDVVNTNKVQKKCGILDCCLRRDDLQGREGSHCR
jgi:hypothetical protein